MGAEIPDRGGGLAASLGPGDTVLCVSRRDQAGDLYDQRDRERQRPAAQDCQDARPLFPSDDAASKLIWLALRNITADWGKAAHHWKEAMNQFAILYAERFTRDA